MRAVTAIFPHEQGKNDYERMLRVLRLSIAERSPRTPLDIYRARMDSEIAQYSPRRDWVLRRNAMKAKCYREILRLARDGECLVLLDCDTMVTGDLSSAFDQEFDLAVTEREDGNFVWNTGVLFVRVSDTMREFFARWYEVVLEMLADKRLHNLYKRGIENGRKGYGGIHQAALGKLYETCEIPGRLIRLPCRHWNAVREDWRHFGPETRVVHLLQDLQKQCLGRVPVNRKWGAIVELWRRYEAQGVAA